MDNSPTTAGCRNSPSRCPSSPGTTPSSRSQDGRAPASRIERCRRTRTERQERFKAQSGFKPDIPTTPITITLGYGRKRAGRVGTGQGFDAYQLRTSAAPWIASGVKIRKTGETYELASTQGMQSMDTPDGEHRPLVRETSLEEYKKEPGFAQGRRSPARPDALPAATSTKKSSTPGAWRSI